jgi:hypothetical protein
MIEAMDWAGSFLTTMMRDNPDWAFEFAEDMNPNLLNQFPTGRRNASNPVYNVAKDRMRGRSIYAMCWKLAPDEAMIIEWDANDLFWMITNMGPYMTSMDYLYRPVSYTPSRTRIDSDGKIRLVMAHHDPGFHNWLDTSGFEQGIAVNRNQATDRVTEFRTRVVKCAELDGIMPQDSARVTPEKRSEMMRARFHAILRRYML